MEETKTVINVIRKEKQNSYEYGKPSRRSKIYYEEISELKTKLKEIFELEKLIDDGKF